MTSRAQAARETAATAAAAAAPAGRPPTGDLLARLRSGHGDGARRALATADPAARAEVIAALDSCVLRDPRAVPATESRSLYYARLYDRLGAGLDALAAHLICDEDWTDEDADRTALPLAVLGTLARAGRADAVALLRRYAAEGRDWTLAIEHLARAADPAALSGMLALALERGEDDELYDCVRQGTGMRPWRVWGFQDARMRAIVEQVDLDWWRWELARGKSAAGQDAAPSDGPQVPARMQPTVDQVLSEAAASPRRSFVCGRRLASVATAEHRALILAAAWSGAAGARVAALRYLGDVGDPALLDLAENALGDEAPAVVRQAAVQAVGGLRTREAVGRARDWLGAGKDGALGDVAVRILAGAGGPADGPVLIAALQRCRHDHRGDRRFALGDLVDGVGRLGLVDAVEPVRDVYLGSPCAGLRGRAVDTLARIEPAFGGTTAVECLWDCEAGTRRIAVERADLAVDGVLERFRELARDPSEDEGVRSAARRRLAAL